MSTTATIVLIIVLVAVVATVGWFVAQRMRSRKLRERFGPEYDRHVERADSRRAAERELAEREKRHARLRLTPLSDDARGRYVEQWTLVQEQFVDQPGEAVVQADVLVHSVMRERGYPDEGFDQHAEDLSVEHADTVDDYRNGLAIRSRHEQGQVSTEDLRKALVHYRAVFSALVGSDVDGHTARPSVPAARDGHRDSHRDGARDGDLDGHRATPDGRTDAVPADPTVPVTNDDPHHTHTSRR